MATTGEIVRRARKERGLSQGALGKEVSVSQRTISAWERDQAPVPRRRLPVVARVLQLDHDDLKALSETVEASLEHRRDRERALDQSTLPHPPLVFTVEQAADVLQCSVEHVQALVARRGIPHVRLGNLLTRIPRDALAVWLEREAMRSVGWSSGWDSVPLRANGGPDREIWLDEVDGCSEPN